MYRFVSVIALVLTLGASCALPSEGEDNMLEKSRPATEMAKSYDDLDAPADYGFKAPDLSSSTLDAAGFPRWYCPKSIITRAQMASFITRTVNGPTGNPVSYANEFHDVTVNNAHADAIAFVANEGISVGCSEEAFCPDDGVTRGQMALYVMRMMHGADFSPAPAEGVFGDVPVGHMHAAAIEQLGRDGLDLSCEAGKFCPDRPISRDETAAFLVGAKYEGALPAAQAVFSDVAPQNPYSRAVNVLARDGVSYGCEAPRAGFRLQGEPLTERQRDWILYFAGRTLPRLTQGYGDAARAFTVGARVIWWSLKEGVFGTFDDPFRHALCNGDYIGPFETCGGEWEVGLTATRVPNDSRVLEAAAVLYPGQSATEVALDLVSFGRELSSTFDAGEYPINAGDWVSGDPTLMRSWLARDATIGAWLIIDDIERDCVDGAAEWCFGDDWEASRDFAPNKERATLVQADLRELLVELRPR